MKLCARADTAVGFEHVRLTAQLQRFCPLCDRPFLDAEAVLRCGGCGVLYHPACWVKNDGCSTEGAHSRQPAAEAYRIARPLMEPHPGEGTRIARRASAASEALPPQPIPLSREGAERATAGATPTLPAPTAYSERRHAPAPYVVPERPEGTPRRYQPPPAEAQLIRKPLPKLYRSNRLLEYWYLPVAALLAVGVAAGVIFAVGALVGGDDEAAPQSAAATTIILTTPEPTGTTAKAPAVTASATALTGSPSVGASGRFRNNETVFVTGTGSCLNVRTAPGVDNPAVTCVAEGAPVEVRGGPESAGGLRWWKVSTPAGDGWAAEDYLTRQP